MHTLLLAALAIAPGTGFILYLYQKDRYDPEPLHLLFRCFIMGALSTFPVGALEVLASNLGFRNWYSTADIALYAFGIIALLEEGFKYLILRWYAFPLKSFNEPFDGIIYSIMISMGFATTENLVYVLGADTTASGIHVALIRSFTAVPAHATFAVLMGFFMGMARFSTQRSSWLFQILGLLTAIGFHGAYDFFLFAQFTPGIWGGAMVSLGIGVFLSYRAIRIHQQVSKGLQDEGRFG